MWYPLSNRLTPSHCTPSVMTDLKGAQDGELGYNRGPRHLIKRDEYAFLRKFINIFWAYFTS